MAGGARRESLAAMNETPHTLILRLWLDRECLRGSVSTPDGDPHEFSGRLGLIGAIDDLLDTRLDQRAENPCIGRDRADLVLAGCAILEAIRRAFPAERLRIADRGLREGLLMNMMREDGVWRRGGYR